MRKIYCIGEYDNVLERAPYSSFMEKYVAKDYNNAGEKVIEIPLVTGENEEFVNGIYYDSYNKKGKINFSFKKIESNDSTEDCILIKCTYLYEFASDFVLDQIRRVSSIKKRATFFYIPDIEYFEMYYEVGTEEVELHMDVIIDKESNVIKTCYCLLNQIITMFSLDN